jgi:ferritin-like metal-binding protein YciE
MGGTYALPKVAEAASSSELRDAIEEHLGETRGHVQRLEKVFQVLGTDVKMEHCEAMEGLIGEGEEIIEADGNGDAKDAALIGAAQRVEHYEIAAYGTAGTLAEQLGKDEAASLLQETLDEESAADQKLTNRRWTGEREGRELATARGRAGGTRGRPGPRRQEARDGGEEREAVRGAEGQGDVQGARRPDRQLPGCVEGRRQGVRLWRKLQAGRHRPEEGRGTQGWEGRREEVMSDTTQGEVLAPIGGETLPG